MTQGQGQFQTGGFPPAVQPQYPPQGSFPPPAQGFAPPQGGLVARMEESSFPVLNTGYYRARILSITPEEQQFGTVLKWVCEILGLQEEMKLTAMCSFKLTPKSKLYEWLCALGYGEITMGQNIDVLSLVGREVSVYVQKEEKGNRTFSNIKHFAMLPPGGGQPMPMAQPAPAYAPQGAPIQQGGVVHQAAQPMYPPQQPMYQPQAQVPTAAPPPAPMAPPPVPPTPPAPQGVRPQEQAAPRPPARGDNTPFF